MYNICGSICSTGVHQVAQREYRNGTLGLPSEMSESGLGARVRNVASMMNKYKHTRFMVCLFVFLFFSF
jgi:hypothetical protein